MCRNSNVCQASRRSSENDPSSKPRNVFFCALSESQSHFAFAFSYFSLLSPVLEVFWKLNILWFYIIRTQSCDFRLFILVRIIFKRFVFIVLYIVTQICKSCIFLVRILFKKYCQLSIIPLGH